MPSLKVASSAARTLHQDAVMRVLASAGASSRRDLQEATGLSRSTISTLVAQLLESGAIETCPAQANGRGRPVQLVRLPAPQLRTWLGIEFSHGRMYAVLVRGADTVAARTAVTYAPGTSWDERFAQAEPALEEMIGDHRVDGIGIGFPSSAVLRGADLISRGQDGALELVRQAARTAARRYSVPVSVDNNVRLAGLAEMTWQAPAQAADQVYVRISDGIGAALLTGGRLVTGASGFGGEIGHLTVEAEGQRCRCGKRGCLETVASADAVIRRARAGGLEADSLDTLAAAYRAGQRPALEAVAQAGRALGQVLGHVCVLLDPARVVLTGTLLEVVPHLADTIREEISLLLLPVNHDVPLTTVARLGEEAGALGAAVLAMTTCGPGPHPAYPQVTLEAAARVVPDDP